MYQLIQKDFDGKMQEFVAGISHRIMKVKDYAKSSEVVQTSCTWQSDSMKLFKSFANGMKVRSINAVSEIYSKLICLC